MLVKHGTTKNGMAWYKQYHTKRYLGGSSDDVAFIRYGKSRHGMTPYRMVGGIV